MRKCTFCMSQTKHIKYIMAEKKPKYIAGVGWRYETEHSQKRRCPGHRYSEVGTYLVTLVVEGRKPVFGSVAGNIKALPSAADYPATELSPLGEKILREELPKIHAVYPMVQVWSPVCIMPDHIHLIIRIAGVLPPKKHLGTIVGAFKGGVSRAWGGGTLFEEGYNDRILMRDGQLENWKGYLRANPYRWMVRHCCPELMQRSLCITIGGIRYGAFGNFMLLRHPEKLQVFFHRRMADDRLVESDRLTPDRQKQQGPCECGHQRPDGQGQHEQKIATEQTLFWQRERCRLVEAAERGDVLVTPGISECEKRIKNECLQERYRLIHIQDKPIGQYWKPEKSRFEACISGTLLILAPWQEDQKGDTDYERFHNLNTLAATICALDAETAMRIAAGGER